MEPEQPTATRRGPRLRTRIVAGAGVVAVFAVLCTGYVFASTRAEDKHAAKGCADFDMDSAETAQTYIVMFRNGVDPDEQAAKLRSDGHVVSHVYHDVFPGLAAELTEAETAALCNAPAVASVEENQVFQLDE